MNDVDLPIVLLPGMAADSRLFRLQRPVLSNLWTPDWIEPRDREPLADYAKRFAQVIAPVGRCFVGGASFGGMVALEMATHLNAKACFLIASVRSNREFPLRYRALRPVAILGPTGLGQVAAWVSRWLRAFLPGPLIGRLKRLSRPDAAFLRWASWAALTWQPSAESRGVRVHQIHGSADRTFPIKYVRPDIVIDGAGHVLPLTHAGELNKYIRRIVANCGERERTVRDS